jgi:hypothetical protein
MNNSVLNPVEIILVESHAYILIIIYIIAIMFFLDASVVYSSVLNPVTMILVEAFMRREVYCKEKAESPVNNSLMCRRLGARLSIARGS